jgi:hypothetical protein
MINPHGDRYNFFRKDTEKAMCFYKGELFFFGKHYGLKDPDSGFTPKNPRIHRLIVSGWGWAVYFCFIIQKIN